MENTMVKIGKVNLDYSKYTGKDSYSDGDIEAVILDAVVNGTTEELLKNSNEWAVLYHLSDIRKNVIEWISFPEDAEVLEIGSGCGAITGALSKKVKKVTCVELSERRSLINANRHKDCNNIEIKIGNFQDIESDLGKYDYVTLVGVLEYAKQYITGNNSYVELLKMAKKHLKDNGRIIVAIENKMGLKYLNGACEDHTGRMYSGINDYIEDDGVRTFSSNELGCILENAGLKNYQFYCAIPDYKLPNIICSFDYNLKPGNVRTFKTNYDKVRLYNFREDIVNDQLCNDKMYNYMSNSYVVITGDETEKVVFTKFCRERRKQYQIATAIIKSGDEKRVIKYPLTKEALDHVISLKRKGDLYNGACGASLNCTNGEIIDEKYITNHVEGETIDEMLYAFRHDIDRLVVMMQKYATEYLIPEEKKLHPFIMSDEFREVFGDGDFTGEMCTDISNIDALFSNIEIDDTGKAWIFDFEWVFDFDVPYKYTIWRVYRNVYYKYLAYLKSKADYHGFMKRFDFTDEELDRYYKMELHFAEHVFGVKECEKYTAGYVKPYVMQNTTIY